MRVIAKVMAIPSLNVVFHRVPQKRYQGVTVETGSRQVRNCQAIGLVLPALTVSMAAAGLILLAVRSPTTVDRPCVGSDMADFVGKDGREFAFASKCPVDARRDHDDAGGQRHGSWFGATQNAKGDAARRKTCGHGESLSDILDVILCDLVLEQAAMPGDDLLSFDGQKPGDRFF